MELYKVIGQYLKKQKLKTFFYIALSLCVWVINLIIPKIIGRFIDSLLVAKKFTPVYNFTLLALVLTTVSVLMGYILNIVKTRMINDTSNSLKSDVSKRLWESNESTLNSIDRGYLCQRIFSDIDTIVSYVINNITGILINSFTVVFILILVTRINKIIGIALVSFVPIYLLLYMSFRTMIFKYAVEFKENTSRYFGVFNQLIGNTYYLKINGVFKKAGKLIEESYKNLIHTAIDYAKRVYLFNSLGSTLSSFSQILVILIGGINIIKGNMSIGDFTIVSAYFNIFIGSIKYFLEVSKTHQDSKASYERILELEVLPTTINGEIKLDEIKEISLNNVSFSYGDKDVIKNFTVRLSKPGIYRIHGKNGEGKTTLLNLLVGICEPNKGEVKINNIDLKEIDKKHLWENLVSFQQQNVVIMGQTFNEALTFGLNDVSEPLLNKHINGFKLDPYISQSNSSLYSLSGGEKQRLSLARVLTKNASVIILDEPMTFLDIESKLYLEKSLRALMKEKIVILISHEEMKTIEDKIIDINLKEETYATIL